MNIRRGHLIHRISSHVKEAKADVAYYDENNQLQTSTIGATTELVQFGQVLSMDFRHRFLEMNGDSGSLFDRRR